MADTTSKTFAENVNHVAELDNSLGYELVLRRSNIVLNENVTYSATTEIRLFNRTTNSTETLSVPSASVTATGLNAYLGQVKTALELAYPSCVMTHSVTQTASALGTFNNAQLAVVLSGNDYYLRSINIKISEVDGIQYDIDGNIVDPIEIMPHMLRFDENIFAAFSSLGTITSHIDDIESIADAIVPNIAEILLADTNAAIATAKASDASSSAASAAASALSASTSASNAAMSEDNAGLSEIAAAASATSASNSATAAAASATTATTKASEATASAASASTSASNAVSSATNAANSASEANTSATAAANSATLAGTSATAAAGSALSASTSESNAAISETNAALSKTASAGSAAIASTKADEATTAATSATSSEAAAEASAIAAASSANIASTSAATATTQAGIATTAATEASASASSAASALASVQTIFDNFDDIYLGAKASDPTVDNDGNALTVGALYYNTTTSSLKIWTGSAWNPAAFDVGGGVVSSFNTRTGDVTLTSGDVTAALGFTPEPADATIVKEATVDVLTNKTLDDVSNLIGADHVHYIVRNSTGSTISIGTVVKASATQPGTDYVLIEPITDPQTQVAIGIVHQTLVNNAIGLVINTGVQTDFDTSAWAVGTILYPNNIGGLTSTKPTSGHYQACAVVLRSHANQGTLLVEFTEPKYIASTTQSGYVQLNDTLTSTSTVQALTAAQGKALNDRLANVESGTVQEGDSVTLTGDVTGTAVFDADGNVSITTTVVDDSHNHVISNIDGLQIALDGKASTALVTTSTNGLMSSVDKTKLDNIEANANNYTLPTASSTVVGGTKLFSDVVQSVVANAVSATASRSYGLQLNSSGQLVVNVPWSDTDTNTFPTTYTWTNGTTSGPTASITGTSPTISVAAIPSASATQSGIVTTAAQTFAGVKTLTSPVLVTPDIGVATGTSFNSITGLASVEPLAPAVTAAVGTSTLTARQDHVHPTNFTATATDIKMNGTQSVGTLTTFPRADHVHPTDTSRAPLASPTFTGTPAAPTAAAGTNTTQVATTAFVMGNKATSSTYGGVKISLSGTTLTITV